MLCFRNFPVVKENMSKRGGEFQDNLSNFFCLTVPKNFRRGLFYCCNNFGYRKGLDKRKGEYQCFPSKFFVSECRKFLLGNLSALCFQKFPVAKKFMEKRGGEGQDFPPENFCLTMPKNFVWELLIAVFQNFPGSEKDFE